MTASQSLRTRAIRAGLMSDFLGKAVSSVSPRNMTCIFLCTIPVATLWDIVNMVRSSDIVLILVAILFPPAAAAFVTGCSCDLLINICLTTLGYIPGHIHALWLIYKKIKAEEMYGRGGYQYLGNGEFEPVYATQGGGYAQQSVHYGATNA